MTAARVVLLYAVFALAATGANLGAQRAMLGFWPAPGGLPAALLLGTAVGLALKYALDKRWIFHDRSTGLAAHGRRFSLYAAMGIATTALFWASELAGWWLTGTDAGREAGALAGLAAGYILKYHLDRRFVFTPATA